MIIHLRIYILSLLAQKIEFVGSMNLNDLGKIAEEQWFWLQKQYPYLKLHEFVVMPNHIHGIIEIVKSVGKGHHIVGTGYSVGTGRDLSLRVNDPSQQKIKSISEIMGAYKTTVSKKIHLLENGHFKNVKEFAWQRSFYDRIIRDEISNVNAL